MKCVEFRGMAESYQAGELPVDTNHEVISHLDGCAACRGELEARIALRLTLREAFKQSPTLAPDTQFVAGVRRSLLTDRSASHHRFGGRTSWLAIAASLLLVVAAGWALGRGAGRPLSRAGWASAAVSALAAHAAGDHRYCALEHALDEPVITLEEAARRYNPAYASLREVVAQSAPVREGGLEILGAHWCVFKGQSFGHVIAQRGDHVVSILVAPTSQASAAGSPPSTCRSAEGLQVACFDARGHGVFVVSDLAEGDVLQLARSLAPVLQAYLAEA